MNLSPIEAGVIAIILAIVIAVISIVLEELKK